MRKLLDQAYTYLKHAEKDPDELYTHFDPKLTQLVIGAACKDYQDIYRDFTLSMMIFRADWYSEDSWDLPEKSTLTPEVAKSVLDRGGGAAQVLKVYDLHPELAEPLEAVRKKLLADLSE